MTHHIHYLKNAGQIILLKDGEIKDHGNYNQIISSKANLSLISSIELEREESFKRRESIKAPSRSVSIITSNSEAEAVEFNRMISSVKKLEISNVNLVT